MTIPHWSRLIRLSLLSLMLATLSWLGMVAPTLAQPLPTAPIVAAIFHFSDSRPTNLGIQAGKLAPCPATPNCVSSQSTDSDHAIAPLSYSSSAKVAFNQLKTVVEAMPGAAIVTEGDRYLYAEFTSALMGFVDDVEFYLDNDSSVIQVRSASRLGESDLGVNRQRIDAIRSKL